jgi:hypothetical protein
MMNHKTMSLRAFPSFPLPQGKNSCSAAISEEKGFAFPE